MNGRTIWLLAWNDLRLTVRDRAAFIWMVLLPVAMMWFFGGTGGRSDAVPEPPRIAVVDQDGGPVAGAIVAALRAQGVVVEPGGGAGSAEAVGGPRLTLPVNLSADVFAGTPRSLALDGLTLAQGTRALAVEAHVRRAVIRTLLGLVEQRQGIDDGGRRLVGLDVSTAGRGHPVPGGFAQSAPGMLSMTVLMMTMIYGGVFLTLEKESGMLERQAALPAGPTCLVAGKVLGRLLLATMQIVILVAAGRVLFGVSWGDSPAGLALMLAAYAFAVAALSTLLGALVHTPAQASSLGWILGMVLAALGGCWWPAEVMPDWMRALALTLPTGVAMEGFHRLISFGRGIEAVLLPAAVLAGYGVVSTLLAARRLRVG